MVSRVNFQFSHHEDLDEVTSAFRTPRFFNPISEDFLSLNSHAQIQYVEREFRKPGFNLKRFVNLLECVGELSSKRKLNVLIELSGAISLLGTDEHSAHSSFFDGLERAHVQEYMKCFLANKILFVKCIRDPNLATPNFDKFLIRPVDGISLALCHAFITTIPDLAHEKRKLEIYNEIIWNYMPKVLDYVEHKRVFLALVRAHRYLPEQARAEACERLREEAGRVEDCSGFGEGYSRSLLIALDKGLID